MSSVCNLQLYKLLQKNYKFIDGSLNAKHRNQNISFLADYNLSTAVDIIAGKIYFQYIKP